MVSSVSAIKFFEKIIDLSCNQKTKRSSKYSIKREKYFNRVSSSVNYLTNDTAIKYFSAEIIIFEWNNCVQNLGLVHV